MNVPNRERRDWGLIIFIIPIGIFLIVIVGQLAIGIFPNWRLNADMRSNLDPNSAPGQPASLLQPLLPQILTPMAWAESYLTPGADVSFPPFFVFEPTASPSPTVVSPTPTTATPTASATTPSPTSTFTSTSTPNPTDDDTPTATATATSTSTVTATSTTTSTATSTATGTAIGTAVTPSGTQISSTPSAINTDAPDNDVYDLPNGSYVVINIGGIEVLATPDGNYDLAFYESEYGISILLDQIIIGISNDNGISYYEVFNWGNNIPDTNSNVDTNILPPDTSPACLEPECDNREIPQADLHPTPGTGILIDVDTAPGAPPPGIYDYLVIISPNTGSGDPSQIDAIVVTEVPIPTP